VVEASERWRKERQPMKPLLTNWLGDGSAASARKRFADAGIPTFETPDAAVTGFMQLVRYKRAQDELMRTPPSLPGGLNFDRAHAHAILATALREGRKVLSEVESKALLSSYGVPVVRTEIAADPAAAEAIAADILAHHDACVVKILSDDISHKSDVGGVRLAIKTPREAEEAARTMLEKIRAARPGAKIRGFTIQPMVVRPHAHELIVGVTDDATVGPLLMFGAGGTSVEVVADTAHALPPLDLQLATQLIQETRISRLLAGYRDRPRANMDAIAEALVRISYLVTDNPEIRELDVNPLLADEKGCVALDARMRIADPVAEPRHPMSIRPYPVEWEKEEDAGELGCVLLRPIRPEDEALYPAFFERTTRDDVRLRFFTAGPDLSHKLLARLTQVDYAREMAFVALSRKDGALLGIARMIAEPDYVRAEFAVIVRSDVKGKGLGWRLMQHLIAYARAEGLQEIRGQVLADNTTMLSMCSKLGFEIEPSESDAGSHLVRLRIAAGT
jgi:acetyltransferase